jgi:hypothetical protein
MIYPKTNTGLIPGGYQFTDPRVDTKVWNDTSFLPERVEEVLKFRMANPEIYDRVKDAQFLSQKHVEQEILRYNFNRLDGNLLYFMVTDGEMPAYQPPTAPRLPKCSHCSGDLTPRYCTTCSVPKLTGYYCKKCDKTFAPWNRFL